MRSEDQAMFAASNGLSMRTIDHSQCKHGSLFSRAVRRRDWQYFSSKNKHKNKKATNESNDKTIIELYVYMLQFKKMCIIWQRGLLLLRKNAGRL